MIKIEYKEFTLKSGKKDITPIIHEKNGETLAIFLFCEVRSFKNEIKKVIESVINGEKNELSYGYNACELVIKGEDVFIYNALAQTQEEYYDTCFETNITDFKNVVDEWCKKLNEFRNLQPTDERKKIC